MEKSLCLLALGSHSALSVPVSNSVATPLPRAPGSQANVNTHHSWSCSHRLRCFMPSDSPSNCSLLVFPLANSCCPTVLLSQVDLPGAVPSMPLPSPAGEEPIWVYGTYALSQSSLYFLALCACRTELDGSFPHDPAPGAVTCLVVV